MDLIDLGAYICPHSECLTQAHYSECRLGITCPKSSETHLFIPKIV